MTTTSLYRKRRLAEDINLSERLSRMQGQEIGPSDVARVLVAAGVKFVLVGAHAISGYTGRPRATLDVDVISDAPKKAMQALAKAFPDLEIQDHPVVIRFFRDGREVIDVIKASSSPIFKRVLKLRRTIKMSGETVPVPILEAALAAKFAAMTSPTRKVTDRQQDGVDFARAVEASKRIDLALLEELGELVYIGGGKEILKLVVDARAGRRLEFNSHDI
jgi:hypothetical protein